MKNMKAMKAKAYKIYNITLHATSWSSWLFRNLKYFYSLYTYTPHSIQEILL